MSPVVVHALVVLSAVFWGANFPLAHLVVGEMDPLAAATARFALAAAVMAGLAALRREPVPVLRHARSIGLLGVVGVGGFNLLFFLAMQRTSAVNGALIMATNPLVTALLAAWVLGERPNPRQMAALPVALAGVAVVVLGGGAQVALSPGDGLMLAADLTWAAYNVLLRRLMPAGPAVGNTAAMMAWAAAALAVCSLWAGVPFTLPGPRAATALGLIALAGTVLAYLCYNLGLTRLGAGRTALYLNLVPVCAMMGSAALGTSPTGLQAGGGAVVMAAVAFASLPRRRALAAAG